MKLLFCKAVPYSQQLTLPFNSTYFFHLPAIQKIPGCSPSTSCFKSKLWGSVNLLWRVKLLPSILRLPFWCLKIVSFSGNKFIDLQAILFRFDEIVFIFCVFSSLVWTPLAPWSAAQKPEHCYLSIFWKFFVVATILRIRPSLLHTWRKWNQMTYKTG